MSDYGFVIHYRSLEDFYRVSGLLGRLLARFEPMLAKRVIRELPPFLFAKLSTIRSPQNATARGFVVMAPFLPEDVVTWGEAKVLRKVVAGTKLAIKHGAKTVGLGGFCSIAGNEGEVVSKAVTGAVTSGNTYTAAMALRGLRKAAELVGLQLGSATVAIVGATGDIGSGCARVLVREVRRLKLAARSATSLEAFAESLRSRSACSVEVVKYVKDAIADADLILTATSSLTTLIGPNDIKSGAAICDVAIPHNVAREVVAKRADVLVFEGGLAELNEQYFEKGSAAGHLSVDGKIVFGCLAETMILALENRNENYSLGRGHITPEDIEEIEKLGERHGFKLAPFGYEGTIFSSQQLELVRASAHRQRSATLAEGRS